MGRVPRWVLAEVIRVSPHGLLCGVAMSLWCYRLRDVDLPMPLIATVVAAPYYAVVGFVAGRRRDVTVGAVVGAAVAGIGFLVLCAAILVVPIDAT